MQKFIIDADQINSLIFSVCGEEVKEEYIQDWLDKFAEKPVKGGGEIISAIAAYLERETGINAIERIEISGVEFNKVIDMRSNTHAGFCQEIAAEIAAAIAPLVEAGGDKSKADQIITNFSVGEKVWLYIGSVFQEHNIRYIHIQKGEWGNTYVRYEMELVSGWYPATAIYRTKEAAMADNR